MDITFSHWDSLGRDDTIFIRTTLSRGVAPDDNGLWESHRAKTREQHVRTTHRYKQAGYELGPPFYVESEPDHEGRAAEWRSRVLSKPSSSSPSYAQLAGG